MIYITTAPGKMDDLNQLTGQDKSKNFHTTKMEISQKLASFLMFSISSFLLKKKISFMTQLEEGCRKAIPLIFTSMMKRLDLLNRAKQKNLKYLAVKALLPLKLKTVPLLPFKMCKEQSDL